MAAAEGCMFAIRPALFLPRGHKLPFLARHSCVGGEGGRASLPILPGASGSRLLLVALWCGTLDTRWEFVCCCQWESLAPACMLARVFSKIGQSNNSVGWRAPSCDLGHDVLEDAALLRGSRLKASPLFLGFRHSCCLGQ